MKHTGTQVLTTERLILRRYEMTDADFVFTNWASDPVAARFWSWEPHRDIGTTRYWLRQWIAAYEKPDYYLWCITAKEDSQAIGYIYLDSIDESERSASVHYLLGSAYWNQGLMTEACMRVVEFAFEEPGFEIIRSYYHKENPASGRVLQKCGFKCFKSAKSGEYCHYLLKKCR